MSAETMLALLAAGIYVFDCIVLLERGQALLELRGRRCRLLFGNRFYVIKGKPVAFLNPLTPHVPVFPTLGIRERPRDRWKATALLASGFTLPRFLAGVQLALLAAVIAVVALRLPDWIFLGALLLAYLNAVALLACLARAYRRQGMPAKALWPLAFSALVCLPLSVNALRRATLRIVVGRSAYALVRLVPETERARTAADLAAHLEEAIADYDEASDDALELARMRDALKARALGRT